MLCLSGSQLDGIGACLYKSTHHFTHVLYALQETGLIEKAVVYGDVETAL
jgi:hypothetical protein